ncbi:unnamed protein product, partial [Laminaria digitata]
MSAVRSSRGDREPSPRRQRGTLDRVKELARVRDTEPAKFPSAYAKLRETVPDLDHLLTLFKPPSSSLRSP